MSGIGIPSHVAIKQASINDVNDAGNGLFASQSIQPAAEILRVEQPLAAVLDSQHLKDACSNCYVWVPENGVGQFAEEKGTGVQLRACQGCKVVRYCSKDCQARSWTKSHRFECKIFAKLYPNLLPNTVRIVVQLLLRKRAKCLPDEDWQGFLDLQSHIDNFRASRTKNAENLTTWQTIELMSQAVMSYSGSREPLALVQTLVARVLINTLTLTTPTFDPLGLYLAPLSSFVNHSCNPNTVVVYSGATLFLRSLASIPSGSELTISYIDTTNLTASRQADLQSRYFFVCICPSCRSSTTNDLADPILEPMFESLNVRAIEMQNEAAANSPEKAAPLLKAALDLFASYPLWRQPFPTILHTAFLNSIATRSWPQALSYALRAYFYIDPVRYPLVWHPVRVVRKWVLLRCVVRITTLLSEGNVNIKALEKFGIDWQVVAIGLTREVQRGARSSHGTDNSFTIEVEAFDKASGLEGKDVDGEVLAEVWRRLRKIAKSDF